MCYYETFADKKFAYIVGEYINGITLTKYIQKHKQIKPKLLWNLYSQLITGLSYIHFNGYAHRDIKTENIMITHNNEIKYIDFWVSCRSICGGNKCYTNCVGISGTQEYFPPEIAIDFYNYTETGEHTETGDLTNDQKLANSMASDIWSLGVVMYQLANEDHYPFNADLPLKELFTKELPRAPTIKSNYKLDDGRTNTFLDLILINDPSERPQYDNVLSLLVDEIFAVPCK